MDPGGYAEKVKVYLRIQRDDADEQYPQCLHYVSRQIVRFTETAAGQISTEAFVSRDKIPHSPQQTEGIRAASLPATVMVGGTEKEYAADYVFEPDESLEYIYNYITFEPAKLHLLLSIGRSDLVSGLHGLALSYVREVLALGGEVTIGCAAFTGDKATNYLPEPYFRVNSIEEAVTLTQPSEFFQGKKPRDGVMVFSVFVQWQGGSGGVQFVEATQDSKTLDLLLQVLTNSDSQSDQRAVGKCKLFDVLKRTVCYGSRITVLGNLNPTIPLSLSTSWVLRTTAEVMRSRHRSTTMYTNMLIRHIERLELQNLRLNKALEDKQKRENQEIENMKLENEQLRKNLEMEGNQGKTRIQRLEKELNETKNLQLIRETALSDCKERIKELERDVEMRKFGISSQFQDTTGPINETMQQLREENEEIRRKNSGLEATVNALKACLAVKSRREAETQTVNPELEVCEVCSQMIPPGNSSYLPTESHLNEQLHSMQLQVEALQSQLHSTSTVHGGDQDQKQCKALYKLLTECWLYTDWALRGFKHAFDQMQAAMELKLRARELKIAEIEHRLSQTHNIHTEKLEKLGNLEANSRELEMKVSEMQLKFNKKEEECVKMKENFSEALHQLKTKYKEKLQAAKSEGNANAELEERVKKLREQLEDNEETMEMERRRAEKEKRELLERVEELKSLRKPLAANRKP